MKSGHWHPGSNFLPTCKSVAGGKAGTVDAPMEEFPDVVAARYTMDFLRKREDDRPFITFCAFPGPHLPWRVPDSFGIRYKPKDIPLWPNRHDRFEGKPLFQRKLRLMEETVSNSHCTTNSDDELRELLACNFSYLELIDQQVGEVINTLKELGQYEETTIIFTADHGDMAGAHGFISKGAYMYDEVYRIPLLMKTAGETTPRRVASPVHLMDVTATCLHVMAGSEQIESGTTKASRAVAAGICGFGDPLAAHSPLRAVPWRLERSLLLAHGNRRQAEACMESERSW